MFASDIQINGAADAVPRPAPAARTALFSADGRTQADSSETKQSTVINEDIFQLA